MGTQDLPSNPPTENTTDPMLQYFKYHHLPTDLQRYSKPFAVIAADLVRNTPRNPERTAALRKLLEAKDAAVRSVLPVETYTVDQLDPKKGDAGDTLTVSLMARLLRPHSIKGEYMVDTLKRLLVEPARSERTDADLGSNP